MSKNEGLVNLPEGLTEEHNFFTPPLDLPSVARRLDQPSGGGYSMYDEKTQYYNAPYRDLGWKNSPGGEPSGKIFGLYLDQNNNPYLVDRILDEWSEKNIDAIIQGLKNEDVTTIAPYIGSARVLRIFQERGGSVSYCCLGYYSLPSDIFHQMFLSARS